MINQKKIWYPFVLLTTLTIIFGCSNSNDRMSEQDPFSAMSYNIRFDNPADGEKSWDNRKDQLVNLIHFYEPDFLGTQEGLRHQLDYIIEQLPYYQWIGVARGNGSMEGEFSALFYDSRRFKLIKDTEQTFWLSDTPSEPSKGWDADYLRIVTLGMFKDKHTNKKVTILNTHFDHVGETARLESAKLIVETIQEDYANLPVILMGDFNATPDSEPYQTLTSGSSNLEDAFYTSKTPNAGPSFTFEGFSVKSESEKRRIDYIFTNIILDVKKHAIISSFNDFRYPSDHMPVIATMEFNKLD